MSVCVQTLLDSSYEKPLLIDTIISIRCCSELEDLAVTAGIVVA